ncbi:hypothetical protein AB0E75_25755 [Streptomyces griseoviridis]|nr:MULTISPECIES: hypothetical protein [Streptomyces]
MRCSTAIGSRQTPARATTDHELADLAGDHLADIADATEQGIRRIKQKR